MSRWIITVSDQRPVDEIVEELKEHGFAVEQVLDAIGSIVGQAEKQQLSALRAVAGVEEVAPDEPIDVGPPDSPIS